MSDVPEVTNEPAPQAADQAKAPQGASAPQKKTADKKVAPTPKRTGLFFLLLLNLVLIGGLAGLTWFYLEQDKAVNVLFSEYNSANQQGAATANRLAAVESSQLELQSTISQANKLLTEQAEQLDQLNRELISTRLRINDSGAGASQAWLLAEAESLLRLAQQRLIIARDVRAATGLFIASDDVLKQINDPAVFSVREVLAVDLAALQATREIDVQSLYLQLGALSGQVDTLLVSTGEDRAGTSFADATAATTSVAENVANQEQGFFASVIDSLGDYIVIRRRDEAIQPLLTPDQEFYIRKNIQLLIEQGRLALLRGQTEIYRDSLTQAITNIGLYTRADTTNSREALLQNLTTLRDTAIVTPVPSIANTLAAIRQILPGTVSGNVQ